MYIFHLALCRWCTRAKLICATSTSSYKVSSGQRVISCSIIAEEAGFVDDRGPTYRYLCIFCPYLLPRICQEYVQLLIQLEILPQIKAATDSGLRTHSQITITTSKLPFVALTSSVPLSFVFTELNSLRQSWCSCD
jgi:hypothetical protein